MITTTGLQQLRVVRVRKLEGGKVEGVKGEGDVWIRSVWRTPRWVVDGDDIVSINIQIGENTGQNGLNMITTTGLQ